VSREITFLKLIFALDKAEIPEEKPIQQANMGVFTHELPCFYGYRGLV
jgi:hypothetical protein